MTSAIIFGATGATGRHVLSYLLATKEFTKVGEYGRRVTPLDKIQGDDLDKSKLVQKTVDFETISEEQDLKQHWDVVYITLGTTRDAAGSAAAFEKIDRGYVIAASKAVKSSGSQRLVYVSVRGANKHSSLLYTRSKGLTEEGLAALGYEDTIILRPAFIQGAKRTNFRLGETIAAGITRALGAVTSSLGIDVKELGKAVYLAGKLGTKNLPQDIHATTVQTDGGAKFTLIENAGAVHLSSVPDL
ncbi:hypothetical protein CPB86DRAFT_780816 [Serendipita vermifera]|nr:hypothetical protein CPB86DRAFT_780816 [Serendipita vermifera]